MKFSFILVLFMFAGQAFAAVPGEKIYNNNCAICHGANGDGKTPVAVALKPPPANYKELFKTYNSKSVLKARILDILEKGAFENGKPTGMASYKTLPIKDREDVADYLIGEYYKGK